MTFIVALVAVALGVGLGYFFLKWQSTTSQRRLAEAEVGVRESAAETRASAEAEKKTILLEAKEEAIRNSGRAMAETGCHAVKLEGGVPMAPTVRALVDVGIPVMGHIGLTPQSVHALGGYRVQGRDEITAERLKNDARALEDAGAFAVVLELVPAGLAAEITQSLTIPTIGIGAGPHCDGQVLVLHDMLGLNDRFSPKFVKRYANMADDVRRAVQDYAKQVREGKFPDDQHSFQR